MVDFWEESWLQERGFFACLKTNHGDYCTVIKGSQCALLVGVSFEFITASTNPHVTLIFGAERDLENEDNPNQLPYFSLHCKIPMSSIEVGSTKLAVIDKKNALFEHHTHFEEHDNGSGLPSNLFSLSFTTNSVTVDSPPNIFPQLKTQGLARKIQEFVPQARRTTTKKPMTLQLLFGSSDPEEVLSKVKIFGDVLLRVGKKNIRKHSRRSSSPGRRSKESTPIRDRQEEINHPSSDGYAHSSPFVESPGRQRCSSTLSSYVEKELMRTRELEDPFVSTYKLEQISSFMEDDAIASIVAESSSQTQARFQEAGTPKEVDTPGPHTQFHRPLTRTKKGNNSSPTKPRRHKKGKSFEFVHSERSLSNTPTKSPHKKRSSFSFVKVDSSSCKEYSPTITTDFPSSKKTWKNQEDINGLPTPIEPLEMGFPPSQLSRQQFPLHTENSSPVTTNSPALQTAQTMGFPPRTSSRQQFPLHTTLHSPLTTTSPALHTTKITSFPHRQSSLHHLLNHDQERTSISTFQTSNNSTPTPLHSQLHSTPSSHSHSQSTPIIHPRPHPPIPLHQPFPSRPTHSLLEQVQLQRELYHNSSPLSNPADIEFSQLLEKGLPGWNDSEESEGEGTEENGMGMKEDGGEDHGMGMEGMEEEGKADGKEKGRGGEELKAKDLIELSNRVLDLEKGDPRIGTVLGVIDRVLERLFPDRAGRV